MVALAIFYIVQSYPHNNTICKIIPILEMENLKQSDSRPSCFENHVSPVCDEDNVEIREFIDSGNCHNK